MLPLSRWIYLRVFMRDVYYMDYSLKLDVWKICDSVIMWQPYMIMESLPLIMLLLWRSIQCHWRNGGHNRDSRIIWLCIYQSIGKYYRLYKYYIRIISLIMISRQIIYYWIMESININRNLEWYWLISERVSNLIMRMMNIVSGIGGLNILNHLRCWHWLLIQRRNKIHMIEGRR